MSKKKPTVISLFSGAMGLDLGLEKAGFEIISAIENWSPAVKTITQNRPKIQIFNKSIKDLSANEILKTNNLKPGEIDLVCGGPSCQSFSTAGKRLSIQDNRGDLYLDFCRIIKGLQPRFFIMENVPGILSAAITHRPISERSQFSKPLTSNEKPGSAFKVIIEELKKLNYYIVFGILNAADYGVPQIRKRIIILGSRDGEDIHLPQGTHSKDGHNFKNWITLKEAIKSVKSKEWINLPPKHLKYLPYLSSGQNWKNLPKSIQKKAMGGAFYSGGGKTGYYRRLDWKKPAPSLTTSPNGNATLLCHPVSLRPLSVEEYATIQEFPKDFRFIGSISDKYRMIGNAVPIGLSYAIGKELIRLIQKKKRIVHFTKKGKAFLQETSPNYKFTNQTQIPIINLQTENFKNAIGL